MLSIICKIMGTLPAQKRKPKDEEKMQEASQEIRQ